MNGTMQFSSEDPVLNIRIRKPSILSVTVLTLLPRFISNWILWSVIHTAFTAKDNKFF